MSDLLERGNTVRSHVLERSLDEIRACLDNAKPEDRYVAAKRIAPHIAQTPVSPEDDILVDEIDRVFTEFLHKEEHKTILDVWTVGLLRRALTGFVG